MLAQRLISLQAGKVKYTPQDPVDAGILAVRGYQCFTSMQIDMTQGLVFFTKGDWVTLTGTGDFIVLQFAKVTSHRAGSIEWKVYACNNTIKPKWFDVALLFCL